MKTAEEWVSEYPGSLFDKHSIVRKIQLDALKEGMRRAANRIDDPFKTNKVRCGTTSGEIRSFILATAEQLTTKDL